MSVLRWWVSVSGTDSVTMPWHGGCKSDDIGCNEVHKRTAKYPLKSKGCHQTGRIHFQIISVSLSLQELLQLHQLWAFPTRTNCWQLCCPFLSLVYFLSAVLLLDVSWSCCLRPCLLLSEYAGKAVFRLKGSGTLSSANVLDTSQWKEMDKLWPSGLEV